MLIGIPRPQPMALPVPVVAVIVSCVSESKPLTSSILRRPVGRSLHVQNHAQRLGRGVLCSVRVSTPIRVGAEGRALDRGDGS